MERPATADAGADSEAAEAAEVSEVSGVSEAAEVSERAESSERTATPEARAASASATASVAVAVAGDPSAPAASAPLTGDPTGLSTGPDTAAPHTAPHAPLSPADERPKPLHDPDPYSTPPYGEPGPWAPAPPVQHPATTPAHGTAVATQPGAPVPPVQHTAPAPAPGSPVPPVQPTLPAPSPGTAVPPPVQHTAPAPQPGTPVPPPVQPTAPAPGPGTAVLPSQGGPGPAAPAPHPAPVPAHGTAAPAPQPQAPHAAASPAPGALPAPQEATPDPWRRYDPWAASAGAGVLQQTGAAVPSREQRRRRGRRVVLGGILLVALVSGGVGGVVGAYLERNGGVGGVELPQAGKEASGRAPDSVAGIAARALPGVVTLHVSGGGEQGTGTGFVLDDRGHILTNNHVVEPAGSDGEITVTFHSGDTARARVVGRDSGYDLAVVRVSGVKGLTPMPLGNSDNVRVGDPVVAIGAPFDLAGTVTSGIISAKQRPITAGGEKGDGSDVSYVDALQTDAPINPGNSGGPLLDAQGRVIGINSAIRSADSGAELEGGQSGSIGLGFAIPINQGKRVAEELINTGRATHPVIGITLDMNYSGDGARVGTKGNDGGPAVTPGGPGAKAGIKAGDVITEVDGQRVHSGEELIVKTRAHRPGDRLELTLTRGGEKRTISLVLGSSQGD
ncbi:S1C family serine protease [Streptomyces sp. DH24]|uniref:S1C family serine protease n=1 Tax=Streptomyces sp. DH24 TaxID=3040123 RepID=UPI002442F2FA|nr:trypsin-like peptidase domain-containing protein [Streptomyces sp. DH24]MDG9716463.1 trypsin-like peptidase domain-containing protein [Streptomyces sp. DH24]